MCMALNEHWTDRQLRKTMCLNGGRHRFFKKYRVTNDRDPSTGHHTGRFVITPPVYPEKQAPLIFSPGMMIESDRDSLMLTPYEIQYDQICHGIHVYMGYDLTKVDCNPYFDHQVVLVEADVNDLVAATYTQAVFMKVKLLEIIRDPHHAPPRVFPQELTWWEKLLGKYRGCN